MRVKHKKFNHHIVGKTKNDEPIVSRDFIGNEYGDVVETIVLPDEYAIDKAKVYFVVVLDDNTFEKWPIMECTKVDDIYRD